MFTKNSFKTTSFVTLLLSFFFFATSAVAEDLVTLTKRATKSTVAIALYSPIKSKAPSIKGTGFVIHNGNYVVTNYHVVGQELDPTIVEYYVAMLPSSDGFSFQKIKLLEIDIEHDLALFVVKNKLEPLALAKEALELPGTDVAIFGYPLGGALGLFPAVHKGIIATITPDFMPASDTRVLSSVQLDRLQKPSLIYQLDVTAFPGNSGSPVINIETGEIIAVVNKVYVKDGKESALSNPSGISYAIPVKYVNALLKRALSKMESK
ncbi:serine protease [Alteromonas sp. BL110]|uniref:S1 family peptidase n=1 Tax=Alteromonas sp. BL110 TaxID=1714845 RepID=UPI000E498074|nr:serine protease [Alteromonas sp. BL110]AXT39657.1 serine protease [Alteromonas sp. BL110]RKM81856.1 serine protease [Alteromonas sp. BL110]